ncbi:hypothetical protein [Bosea spartocytisi]|nr:hypothetical protein [Bosea spartocytisi]MCT4475012.1 hypothetical protein [Bosea spartocytisi]
MTEQQLCDEINRRKLAKDRVSQSWISRICNGGFKRPSRQVLVVLEYVNIPFYDGITKSLTGRQTIERAIEDVWDGSAKSARAIAQLLRSAGALVRQPTRQGGKAAR